MSTVTIKSNVWSVSVASTPWSIASGLSGATSLPAGTGMLFNLGADYTYIPIDMSGMLFPLDVIFISAESGVVGILRNIQPGQTDAIYQGTGARYFLEVNAGEAAGVNIGDSVSIVGMQPLELDLSILIQAVVATVILGVAVAALGKGALWH